MDGGTAPASTESTESMEGEEVASGEVVRETLQVTATRLPEDVEVVPVRSPSSRARSFGTAAPATSPAPSGWPRA